MLTKYTSVLFYLCLLGLFNKLSAQQTNRVDDLGRKQGLWIYYPDSVFHPGIVSFPGGYYSQNHIDSVKFLKFRDWDSIMNPFYVNVKKSKHFKVKQTFFDDSMHGEIEVYLDTFLVYTGTYIFGKPQGMFLIYEHIKDKNTFYKLPCYTSNYYKGKAHGAFVTFVYGKSFGGILESEIFRIVFYKNDKIKYKIYQTNYSGDKPWIRKRLFKKWYFKH